MSDCRSNFVSALADDLPPVRWPDDGPDWRFPARLSASFAETVERCPEQARQVYLFGRRRPPSGKTIWGSADHAAHEHNFAQKIDSHADLPVDEVQDAFITSFDRLAAGPEATEAEWKESAVTVRDRGAELVAVYHRLVSPRVQPVATERWFELALPSLPGPLVGKIDVETEALVIERKTSGALMGAIRSNWRTQAIVYQGEASKPVEWHLSAAYETPKTRQRVREVRTGAEFPGLAMDTPGAARLAEQIIWTAASAFLAYFERFGPYRPWPGAITDTWACTYCGFRPDCTWWTVAPDDFGGDAPF